MLIRVWSTSREFPLVDEVIIWGPYLTNTTHNSTIIHWKTLEPSIGRVGFAHSGIKTPGISDQSISEKNFIAYFTSVQLNNLEPGQRYSYWIGNNPGNYSFRTLPLDGPFTFIVYGDTREQLPMVEPVDPPCISCRTDCEGAGLSFCGAYRGPRE